MTSSPRSADRPTPPLSDATLTAIAESAFVYNRAHQRLGSYLVACDRRSATVGLAWDDHRFGPAGGAHWPNGVFAALLDHSCALSVVMGLGSTDGVAGTVDLRIDFLWQGEPRRDLHARGEWIHLGDAGGMAHSRSMVFHTGSPTRPIAVATSVVALAGAPS